MNEYITKEECFTCNGKGKLKIKDGIFKTIKEACSNCAGTGKSTFYTCQKCACLEFDNRYSIHTGQCKYCYADMKTGKYLDVFFYVKAQSLPELSKKVQELINKGYFPLGRPVSLPNEYWVAQSIIKKECLKGLDINVVSRQNS